MAFDRNEKILLYGALAAAAWWFYSKSRALAGLVFSFGSVSGISLTSGNPLLGITLNIQNTSTASLIIESFAGNVLSNGTLIGNVYNFSTVSIPGNSQVLLPLQLQLQMIGVVNDVIKAVQTGNIAQELKIQGAANVNSIQLPINITFQVGS